MSHREVRGIPIIGHTISADEDVAGCISTATDQFPEYARRSIRQNKKGEYYQDFYKLVHTFHTLTCPPPSC